MYSTELICPFCTLDLTRIVTSNNHAFAIMDGFPISPGHALIIPKRHIASLFEATRDERDALFDLVEQVRQSMLEVNPSRLPFLKGRSEIPDGFNIGINDGAAAGQTVMHLHIHLIPRYAGDQTDPRGGVRWIFPDKADYWNNG
jgi:diadenosine tetraphosphate (Ap4A) HIT family hydrolase